MALRGDKELGRCFQRVACAIRAHEAERIGVDFITQNTIGQGGGEVLGTDLEKLEGAYKHPAQTYPPLFPLPSTPPPPPVRGGGGCARAWTLSVRARVMHHALVGSSRRA